MKSRWFKCILYLAGVLFLLIIAATVQKHRADARFFDDYEPGLPCGEGIVSDEIMDDTKEIYGQKQIRRYRRIEYTIQARPGERIPCMLALPPDPKERCPAVLLLHGSHQEKEFLDKVAAPFTRAGFAMTCFDQHMRGERRVQGKIQGIFAYRERSWKTVNDARRVLDYLETRKDIDGDRLYLVGASYGAITGCTVVARDKRLKAAVLVVGGGNLRTLVQAPAVKEYLPPWARFLASPMIACLMRPAEPTLYASQTSPVPVLMQNGDQDTVVTPASGKALYHTLGDPKEIRWYPCDHPGLREQDQPVVLQILDEGLTWLAERDAENRGILETPGELQ